MYIKKLYRNSRNVRGWILTSSGESLSVSRAIFGTMLPLGDLCLSIVSPGLLGKMRGFSVATLARRPRIVEDTPAVWLEFATLGDARRRRDEALRCNITVTFSYPCHTIQFPSPSFTEYISISWSTNILKIVSKSYSKNHIFTKIVSSNC